MRLYKAKYMADLLAELSRDFTRAGKDREAKTYQDAADIMIEESKNPTILTGNTNILSREDCLFKGDY